MTVIVVGSINMDLVFTGIPSLPRPGQTVTSAGFEVHPGGKGANQASAAAALGADVRLVAAVGTDDFAERALADLDSRRVNLDAVSRVDGPTGVAAVLLESSGENIVIVTPGANGELSGDTNAASSADAAAVVLACLEVPVPAVLAWAREAARRGWPFVLNPAPAQAEPLPPELLALTTVITPNETELAALGSVDDLLAAGVGAVVVTRGAHGADLFAGADTAVGDTSAAGDDGTAGVSDRAGASRGIHQPAFAVEPVDTTGAGDAFNGGLATALAEGLPLRSAVEIAAAAGALSTLGVGARSALASREQVDALRKR